MDDPLPHDESGIDDFIAAFEDGTLPKPRWTHAAHILTGACYVHAYGERAALDRMRGRVSAYNEAVGGQNTPTSGYHETITVLWIKILTAFRREHPSLTRAPFAVLAVEQFAAQKDILSRYYDFDIIASQEARRTWQPPPLLPLP
jgi:hypothetical protein